MDFVLDWSRRRHHVTANITAGRQSGHHRGIDLPHRFTKFALQDSVVLNRLPSRDADTTVGKVICHPVKISILLGSDHSTGQRDTNHVTVRLAQSFLASLGTQVTIILLVSSVELQQLHVVVFKVIDRGIFEHFVDGASQQVTLFLGNFYFRWACFIFRHFLFFVQFLDRFPVCWSF